jgi:hypothetical protein
MARWLSNGPCPSCGSRDNLASYDDGSKWCWGCHYYEHRNRLPIKEEIEEEGKHKKLPDDFTHFFGTDSVNWFSRYGFTPEQLIRRNVGYSTSRNQTIFTFPGTDLWQARNHNPSRVKYITSGNHDDVLPIFSHCSGPNLDSILVVVEDCLSAIKITDSARGLEGPRIDAMPLLGSHLASSKLNRLKRLYSNLIVWLDHDKGKEAQQIARRATMIGIEARLISTELDPKEYDNLQEMF